MPVKSERLATTSCIKSNVFAHKNFALRQKIDYSKNFSKIKNPLAIDNLGPTSKSNDKNLDDFGQSKKGKIFLLDKVNRSRALKKKIGASKFTNLTLDELLLFLIG